MTNGEDMIHSFNGSGTNEANFKGLTKREYFAAMAMQGLLSNVNGGTTEQNVKTFSPYGISKLALLHADELIDSLNK